MGFPSGGSGYGTPGSAPAPAPSAAATTTRQLSALTYAVAGVGVLAFLLGFLPYGKVSGMEGITPDTSVNFFEGGAAGSLAFLLFAGLLAGLSVLPKQDWMGVAAAASVSGFVVLLIQAFNVGGFYERAFGLYLVLVLGFVQAVLATVAVLGSAGVIKASGPRAANAYGAQPAGYGPPQVPQQPAARPQQPPGQFPQPGYPQAGYAAQPGYGSAQPPARPGQPGYGQAPYSPPQAYSQPPQSSPAAQPGYGVPQPNPGYGSTPSAPYAPYGSYAGSPQGAPERQERPDAAPTQQYQSPLGAGSTSGSVTDKIDQPATQAFRPNLDKPDADDDQR